MACTPHTQGFSNRLRIRTPLKLAGSLKTQATSPETGLVNLGVGRRDPFLAVSLGGDGGHFLRDNYVRQQAKAGPSLVHWDDCLRVVGDIAGSWEPISASPSMELASGSVLRGPRPQGAPPGLGEAARLGAVPFLPCMHRRLHFLEGETEVQSKERLVPVPSVGAAEPRASEGCLTQLCAGPPPPGAVPEEGSE